ncbi:ornithine carbamoyltransferase [Candidatus Bathyarchaeota archaeon]|nr:ornithine carbamoyltransferase [Candidatus Bathyarchaeota archaeon]MBS7613801.1 ornithine carbamoyltransferase [Candidatus Bathyarchaeota archaeon]MBS7618772.1 ornithine carbamoyltransferase [Candidatus Bathyarchaeota archaeon]
MLPLKSKHLLTLQELEADDILQVIDVALAMKRNPQAYSKSLEGKTLAMIFQKPSTRTRVSFEVAMRQLGGYALYLRWDDLQLGRGEAIKDTARVLGRYVDVVMARVLRQTDLDEYAKWSPIPVINGLSDRWHPCQILGDLLTMREVKGFLKGLKLAYVGDGNNVCNSLLIGCSKVGVNISVACAKGYEPLSDAVEWAYRNAEKSGAKVEILNDPEEAVKNADVVYTDVFVSMGFEAEREKRLKDFLPKYQVNCRLMSMAGRGAVFMHCLPARRGEEVTDEVLDSAQSVVLEQAENRLHSQKALLYSMLT